MFNNKRPQLNIPKTKFESILGWIGLIVFFAWVTFLIASWSSIPTKVPGHFGISGEITRWGSKWEMLILPIIAGGSVVILNWLRKHPEWHNYTIQITEQNAPFYYKLSRQMLSFLSTTIILCFAWLSWDIVQIAKGHSSFLNSWFMPIFLTATFSPMIVFIIRMFRYQSK